MSPKNILVTVAALAVASVVTAAQSNTARVEQLRTARDKLAAAADQTKGGPRYIILQERQRVNNLLDDLDNGRPVDPAAVDRALQRAQHPLP